MSGSARRWWSLVASATVALAACGGGGGDAGPPVTEVYPPDIVELGRMVYADTCSVCHGRGGGGSVGPSLIGIANRITLGQHIAIIQNGTGGMPPFSGTLTPQEIAAVAAFERVGLG